MKFNPNKAAFGRHETFPLRYGWLTRGYLALRRNSSVFESDNAVVDLGVGKNMVNAIRFWMRACGLIAGSSYSLTPLAEYIFDEKKGVDPYLEDEATLWLLHWKLSTNAEQATAWFWFFNQFHKPSFNSRQLQEALLDFVKVNVKNKFAETTVKSDASVLTRMYCQSMGNTRTPVEEALDSPLALLGLMTQGAGGRSYQSQLAPRPDLAPGILGYAVMELIHGRGKKTLPIEELMYCRDGFAAPGAVFRLTENDLISKLENLTGYIPGAIEVRETAGIHQLYLKREIKPEVYLDKHYRQRQTKGKAA